MKISIAYIMLMGMMFTGCSTEYFLKYDTTVQTKQNLNSSELTTEDEFFKFRFSPLYNGIYFEIQNKTEKSAYLNWDKSYFVEPDGNTAKLLNTDVIDTDDKIIAKENFESIIPQNANFNRFSTAVTKLEVIRQSSFRSYTEFRLGKYESYYSGKIKEFFYYSTYWPFSLSIAKDEVSSMNEKLKTRDLTEHDLIRAKLDSLLMFVKENNNLGLGFSISYEGKQLEYRFNFPIYRIQVMEKDGTGYKVIFESKETDNWEWKENPKQEKIEKKISMVR